MLSEWVLFYLLFHYDLPKRNTEYGEAYSVPDAGNTYNLFFVTITMSAYIMSDPVIITTPTSNIHNMGTV